MKRDVFFSPAFDKRNPEPKKNYGVGAVRIKFLVSDERGATQFVLYTDWYPAHVQRAGMGTHSLNEVKPAAWDLGYHSPVPQYEGQKVTSESCEYIGGRPCYCDGSGLMAEPLVYALLDGGSDAVWQLVEQRHEELFGAVEVPA